ncbi:hypothetical protein F5B22DRAFT_87347 [Xylaria bambusicola]|uniref:uncharacterized protein n=1 Tax=Xylaria bambusicola TaxID=326684 RepID=UPI002007A2FF|nr:uncharacterized protein F5B22DRAFT_87347 [Xylaria bambusicola]KAI0517989.1 hypothetical protein F5B22DRAFT_87347 [Xylaria bambusicola]
MASNHDQGLHYEYSFPTNRGGPDGHASKKLHRRGRNNQRDQCEQGDYDLGPGKDLEASYEHSSGTRKFLKNNLNKIRGNGLERDERLAVDQQQRLEKELHELRQISSDQRKEIEELKRMIRDGDEKSNKLKRRNEKLQAQIDNDESVLGHQKSDEDVKAPFQSMNIAIKNWTSKWCDTTRRNIECTFDRLFCEKRMGIVQSILPLVKNQDDFISLILDVKRRRKFVRGWIGFHIANDIFRTLPGPSGNESGSDIWIPAKIRGSVDEVEHTLLSSGKCLSMSDFNQWRSLTMTLLFKKYPSISDDAWCFMSENARDAVHDIAPIIPRVDRDAAVKHLIETVYRPALEFAQLLRRQRALWSVRFPCLMTVGRSSIFNPACMKDSDDDEEEPRQLDAQRYIEIVSTPVLYKSGNIDGKQYDEENVVEKAEISCEAFGAQ